ncbi:MAG: hypothetical protein WCR30_03525 [Clostridia bacterium]
MISKDVALTIIFDKDEKDEKKIEYLQGIEFGQEELIKILLNEYVSESVKLNAISIFSLRKKILSEKILKEIFENKKISNKIKNSLALNLTSCFSGSLVLKLLNNNLLSSISKTCFKNHLLNKK